SPRPPLALVQNLAGLDGSLLAADVDEETPVSVDLDPDPALAVELYAAAAQEVTRAEAVVDTVEPTLDPGVIVALESLQDRDKERSAFALDPVDRVEAPHRDPRALRKLVALLVDVHADPDDDGSVGSLGEDARYLAAVEHDVVRPLHLDSEGDRAFDRLRDCGAGDERDLGDDARCRRPEEDRSENRGSWRSGPAASEPAAALRLLVADGKRSLGHVCAEQLLRGLAARLVDVRFSEA